MMKPIFLIVLFGTLGCSVIGNNFDHADRQPLMGNTTCDVDNPCRGNQQQVNICIENPDVCAQRSVALRFSSRISSMVNR